MALHVSAFVLFAIGIGVRNVHASCGDYLGHARLTKIAIFADQGNDSLPVPVCQGGNCRSAPSQLPVEPSRVVLVRRQPSDFQSPPASSNSTEVRIFESVDDVIPSSATLEVSTPPPILIV